MRFMNAAFSHPAHQCILGFQVCGGRGYMRESPLERLYRDIRVDRIWEGTSEIQRLIIGNEIAKRGVEGLLEIGGIRD